MDQQELSGDRTSGKEITRCSPKSAAATHVRGPGDHQQTEKSWVSRSSVGIVPVARKSPDVRQNQQQQPMWSPW
jgi:hypothetical protein